jgi:hypothetical protein
MRCCPKEPVRKIPRSIHEMPATFPRRSPAQGLRTILSRAKRVEMLFAHLNRFLRLGRLRVRGPRGAQDEFTLAAIAQNLRRLGKCVARPPMARVA